jgi:hypothetical protein
VDGDLFHRSLPIHNKILCHDNTTGRPSKGS